MLTLDAVTAGYGRVPVLRDVRLDPEDPYVREVLRRAARLDAREVRQSIEHDVRAACEHFADDIAAFVAAELYDRRIVPAIEAFRDHGGTIAELEEAVLAELRIGAARDVGAESRGDGEAAPGA